MEYLFSNYEIQKGKYAMCHIKRFYQYQKLNIYMCMKIKNHQIEHYFLCLEWRSLQYQLLPPNAVPDAIRSTASERC